jgi:hypothetical protein
LSDRELEQQHRLLRLSLLVAACALLCVLVLVVIRTGQEPWRVLQERFVALDPGGSEDGNGLGIRQYYTCASEVDRCSTCHLGIERKDLADASLPLPFRAHGPGLGKHLPDRVGCGACHGGNVRALDPVVAHARPDRRARDPLMRRPHIQASCARCHVPGAKPGQERLEEGAWLYLGLGCMLCHPLQEGGRGGVDFGPDLTMIGRKDLDYLKASLIEPTANFPGSTMPSFRLALEKEPHATESLLIYLESLVLDRYPACGTREKSWSLVISPCATCHAGEAGRAGGRLKHGCTYLLKKSAELRCGNCHSSGIPQAGNGEGYCPLLKQHREACSACHDSQSAVIPAHAGIQEGGGDGTLHREKNVGQHQIPEEQQDEAHST